MRSTCPSCGARISPTQRLAALRRPARCGDCGRHFAARPGSGGRLLFAIAQHAILVAAVVAAFMAASWWPLVLGAVIGTVGLEAALRWMSPRVVVTEARSANAVRPYVAAALWAVIVVLVAAALGPLVLAAR